MAHTDFLQRLSPEGRQLLEQIGDSIGLEPGQMLMKRGDPGGDVFRVERGQLEVIDNRSRPEVVLDLVGPGELLGELAFLDGSPRSADVVAGHGCVVTRWPRSSLNRLLDTHPSFAAEFWKSMASEISDRLREINASAVVGAFGRFGRADASAADNIGALARSIAREAMDGLASVDLALRRNPSSVEAQKDLVACLDALSEGLGRLSADCRDRAELVNAVRHVSQSVNPYLLQSTTAELCLSRPEGLVGGSRVMEHLLAAEPMGEGSLGHAVDTWLLDLPFPRGIRIRNHRLVQVVKKTIQGHPGSLRVLLLNTGVAGVAMEIYRLLEDREGDLTFVEAERPAIERLGLALERWQSPLHIRYVHDRLVDLSGGRALRHFKEQDLVIALSLLDYLPSQVAIAALRNLGLLISKNGRLLAVAAGPTPDAPTWEHLLGWPFIRRSADSLKAIFSSAGYRFLKLYGDGASGFVILAGNMAAAPMQKTRSPKKKSVIRKLPTLVPYHPRRKNP